MWCGCGSACAERPALLGLFLCLLHVGNHRIMGVQTFPSPALIRAVGLQLASGIYVWTPSAQATAQDWISWSENLCWQRVFLLNVKGAHTRRSRLW